MLQAYLTICWEIGRAETKSVEHSFCAKQCVMLMEKIALKERCWLLVSLFVNYCYE